ncbi:hypothetical protein LMG22037_05740 [Paraburkholderia phenoliruptrix]|uniref:Methyltransferase type 11 domain-containing protein n=1 Tax=Paraburkholderia phenoliruptrix TaxID=252970 RepID=A0A6J5CCU1_9BURK|nr:class I SAM-dependent methyltransferase [Paraburkholderia phenoliruptrix]CAB3732790.1 hypothetical protein LMG22037_05740 [Paraburkholderia phenoliruptrix]
MNADIWHRFSTRQPSSQSCQALSSISIPDGEPDIQNQISEAENRWIIDYFQQFHLPMMVRAGLSLDDLRILEIGGGFGQLAYGTVNSVRPQYYVATDVFPTLVSTMTSNFKKWAIPNCFSALLDPNENELFLRPNSFNVIQSHSVLHHVLHYQSAVERLYQKLDSPGIMIFCEPCLDAYVYFQTLTKAFRDSHSVSPQLALELDYLDLYIDQRCGVDRENAKFLAQFGAGDKYLYSIYDLQRLAETVGAKLYIQKDVRDARGNFEFELKIRKALESDVLAFSNFLDRILPAGVNQGYFSDLRQVFCLIKE